MNTVMQLMQTIAAIPTVDEDVRRRAYFIYCWSEGKPTPKRDMDDMMEDIIRSRWGKGKGKLH